MAKIALINGSVQKRNYTAYTLRIVKEGLLRNNISIIDLKLKDFNLPFPGEDIEGDDSKKMNNPETPPSLYFYRAFSGIYLLYDS